MEPKQKTAHFIGICGAGMSAVAKLLREQGWRISGSDDKFYPPVSDYLIREGLPCATPYATENIPPDATTIIIGKHAKLTPEQNAEVRQAFALRDQGAAEILSFPDALHRLTLNTENIVVVGSYGKSTTTALTAWCLAHSQTDPSYFIGAIPLDFAGNAHSGKGRYFVLEGDEYPSANWDSSPKFLHYNPHTVLLTSCEHDHFNEFATEEAYLAPYLTLAHSLKPDNLLVACLDGKGVDRAIAETQARTITYSGKENPYADWCAADASQEKDSQRFVVRKRNRNTGATTLEVEIETSLLGEHNRQNIVGCVATLLELEALSPEQIQKALKAFRGLRRRLERKSEASCIAIYEDLSSSRPKSVAALAALRQRYPKARIYAIFQPHTFSFRSRQALEWYPHMFADAQSVLVFSPPDLQGKPDAETLTHEEILRSLQEGNACPVHAVINADEIKAHLLPQLHAGDAVLFMTSGGMEGAIAPVIEAIEEAFPRIP